MIDHSPAFACLPMHAPPSLDDWSVWADWLMLNDPEPWRDRRIRKRLLRGDPNSVERRLSMACAYRPAELRPGVFEWGQYAMLLTEHGWSHLPHDLPWHVLWGIARARVTSCDTIYVQPRLHRQMLRDTTVWVARPDTRRGSEARNPRKRDDTGEHKRGRRR